jgi:hypothetical protein
MENDNINSKCQPTIATAYKVNEQMAITAYVRIDNYNL